MPLMNDNLKMISCSDFRLFLKRLIKDKIEKEWSEDYINDLNLVIFPRSTIKRRYENKGIDLIKLINSPSYYNHVKTNINSNGSLEIEKGKTYEQSYYYRCYWLGKCWGTNFK